MAEQSCDISMTDASHLF